MAIATRALEEKISAAQMLRFCKRQLAWQRAKDAAAAADGVTVDAISREISSISV